ncbi:MAG: MFS transporter [Planctomycetes bacterium]|nr:MFS transporter [Planctomycetota bacterium]
MAEPHNPRSAIAAAAAACESRNSFWLVVYQVLVRIGWAFKTETVIMPAVLDAVVDSGTLRGLLPVLNRGGQSVPPLFMAAPLTRLSRKWPAASITTAVLAACFGILAVAWGPLAASRPERLAVLFLVLYGAFSAVNGVNQLVLSTLQGKLIAPGHRGRSLVASVTIGSVLAVVASLWLLGPWLVRPDGFPLIFAATATCFAAAAVVPAFLTEPPDDPSPPEPAVSGGWIGRVAAGCTGWRRTLDRDPAVGRLAAVAACFATVIILFPHYQAFARESLATPATSLVTWVVVQNLATGLVSLVAGPVADRRGTRIVLVGLVAVSALTPLIVTGLSLAPAAVAARWFWIVYAPLGLNPIALKILTGYALELAPGPAEHPRYVSIVGAALGAPFVLSPAVGFAVDAIGGRIVFLVGSAVIAAGAILALGLPEPRHREAVVSSPVPGLKS